MYKKAVYEKAVDEIVKNAKHKKALYNEQKLNIYKENPELSEIDEILLALGPKIGLAAISGNKKLLTEYKEKAKALSDKKEAVLKKYPDFKMVYNCKKCEDTGYINGAYCFCVYEKAKQIAKEEFLAENCCEEFTFENFDLKYYPETVRAGVTKIFEFVKNYALNFNTFGKNSKESQGKSSAPSGNLLFMGGTGLGKTHLSLSIANVVINKGYGVLYGSADNLLRGAEKEYFSFSNNSEKTDELLNTDLLIIDDLGAEFKTKYTQSIVYNVINTRILKKKPTVISTNLTIDELEEIYTPRIASRIIGNFTVKELRGEDIRQLKL